MSTGKRCSLLKLRERGTKYITEMRNTTYTCQKGHH